MNHMAPPVSHHEALIYAMVTLSASDRNMTDKELRKIGDVVQTLPIFADFNRDRLVQVAEACGSILRGPLPERPAIQQFLDPDGNEGTNGLFRVDDGDGGMHLYWLDEVERVVRVGSS